MIRAVQEPEPFLRDRASACRLVPTLAVEQRMKNDTSAALQSVQLASKWKSQATSVLALPGKHSVVLNLCSSYLYLGPQLPCFLANSICSSRHGEKLNPALLPVLRVGVCKTREPPGLSRLPRSTASMTLS